MKYLISLVFITVLFFSCENKPTKNPAVIATPSEQPFPDYISLSWLVGTWERTNDKPGHRTIETWKQEAPMIYTGSSVTIHKGDTVFREIMRILPMPDIYTLQVSGPNSGTTFFQFTNQTDTSFISENPKHDFPTKIEYRLENDTIKAAISGQGQEVDFIFKKKDTAK